MVAEDWCGSDRRLCLPRSASTGAEGARGFAGGCSKRGGKWKLSLIGAIVVVDVIREYRVVQPARPVRAPQVTRGWMKQALLDRRVGVGQ